MSAAQLAGLTVLLTLRIGGRGWNEDNVVLAFPAISMQQIDSTRSCLSLLGVNAVEMGNSSSLLGLLKRSGMMINDIDLV